MSRVRPFKSAELSEIIMEINDLRGFNRARLRKSHGGASPPAPRLPPSDFSLPTKPYFKEQARERHTIVA
jgi:hypothetical protein